MPELLQRLYSMLPEASSYITTWGAWSASTSQASIERPLTNNTKPDDRSHTDANAAAGVMPPKLNFMMGTDGRTNERRGRSTKTAPGERAYLIKVGSTLFLRFLRFKKKGKCRAPQGG